MDLYGGTRHSSVVALNPHFSPEEIRGTATKHQTNAAFERYAQGKLQDDVRIYSATRADTNLIRLPGNGAEYK